MRYIWMSLLLAMSVGTARSQYRVTAEAPPPHPIDQKYAGRLSFEGSNHEMERSIAAAEADWRALMLEKLRLLMARLPPGRQAQLHAAQGAWEVAFQKDRTFFFGDPDLRLHIGREGEILSKLEFMNRVRQRALDLSEYLEIFGG